MRPCTALDHSTCAAARRAGLNEYRSGRGITFTLRGHALSFGAYFWSRRLELRRATRRRLPEALAVLVAIASSPSARLLRSCRRHDVSEIVSCGDILNPRAARPAARRSRLRLQRDHRHAGRPRLYDRGERLIDPDDQVDVVRVSLAAFSRRWSVPHRLNVMLTFCADSSPQLDAVSRGPDGGEGPGQRYDSRPDLHAPRFDQPDAMTATTAAARAGRR